MFIMLAQRSCRFCIAALILALAIPRSGNALTIAPLFNSSLSATSIITIGKAIAFYEATFSDPITVIIEFHGMTGGLGANTSVGYSWPYSEYAAALSADKTSADDALAAGSVPVMATDPVHAKPEIQIKSANGRAVGLATPPTLIPKAFCGGVDFFGDGCVGLNLSLTDDPVAGGPPFTGLLGVVEHEIDEVLGLTSSLQPDGTISLDEAQPLDLFRFKAPGVPDFHTHECFLGPPHVYFSIDGGITELDAFNNCNNTGDYGDWVLHTPSQVQDAFTDNSAKPFLVATSPETRALDVIGYTLRPHGGAVVPEPSSMVLLATGMATAAVVAGRASRRRPNRRRLRSPRTRFGFGRA